MTGYSWNNQNNNNQNQNQQNQVLSLLLCSIHQS